MIILYVILGLIVLLLIFGVVAYNRFVSQRQQIRDAYSNIDTELRRRYDLIPNLVESVRGYAQHERATFDEVTRARAAAIEARGPAEQAQAENILSGALRQLFALSEAYPDLKANQNFLNLQEELTGTEGRIAYARQFYNDTVFKYNTKIQSFPSNVLAGMLKFTEREYFEADDPSRGPVQVRF